MGSIEKPYCKCELPSLEEEFKKSELVIVGRLLSLDTIMASNTMYRNRRGIKYGRHRYEISKSTFIRAKLLVQNNFKTSTILPDTIYVLTDDTYTSCGFLFPLYIDDPSSDTDFIIYGDRWIDHSIVKSQKGKHIKKSIKVTPLNNTFYTDRCRLTSRLNKEKIEKLEKLKI